MDKYKVLEKIKHNGHTVAKKGDILIAKPNYDRLWGVIELRREKDGKYVCDLGSITANNNCIKC